MAFFFTHCWMAKLALQRVNGKLRKFIRKPENIDDYYFGCIAPDKSWKKKQTLLIF